MTSDPASPIGAKERASVNRGVEGENTRLRHYLASLKRKSLRYSKCEQMLQASIKLLLHYLHFDTITKLWLLELKLGMKDKRGLTTNKPLAC